MRERIWVTSLGGCTAILSRQAQAHRRAGILFVGAMLAMGFSGSLLAARQSLTNPNALGGLMSAYFVVTAFTTVRPPSAWNRRLAAAASVLASAVALTWFRLGLRGLARPVGTIDPAMVYSTFVFGAAMTLAILGDARLMSSGRLRPAARLARHLWRMCVGLFIAVASFFAVPERVARILPGPLPPPVMRALQVVLVLVAMFSWLWRVRRGGSATRSRGGSTSKCCCS